MQVHLLLLTVTCLTAVSAQSGPKKVLVNRNNRDVNQLPQFNGYNYQAPAIPFPEPIFNQQQQQQVNQNFGFTGPQDNGQFSAPAPALPIAPKEAPAVHTPANHHMEAKTEHKVQTVRIIHENHAGGHSNTNVKTVRIIHDQGGHAGQSHGGQVQTVKIVHEERPATYTTFTAKHAEPHTKTVRIVHDTTGLGEVQGRSADQYSTFKIIQDGAAAVHAPIEETQAVQIVENPGAGAYGGAQVHEEFRTLQSLQEVPAVAHQHQNAIVKFVDQSAATGYATAQDSGRDLVTLRVVPSGETVGYQNAYVSNGGYNTVAQEPCPLPYHQHHQQLETIKLVGSHAVPQQQQTVRYVQSNRYPATHSTHYGGNAEIESILKLIQSSGIGASLGGHGHVKLLRVLNK